ncbi:MFS transporter [Lactobacillus panisapium]|uniref:MFS transporter n=1 Tax=Lactobacillus panisapium TaxID=2012495 RepID=UPI0022E19A08|nr:MFS transporter [Lactobacillus panisapium]
MSKNFKRIMLIIALLSLNVVEQAASVVNATIPGMAKSFPQESLVNIELVTTVVSIFVTIFVLISGAVVRYIGQRNTAILGLIIATISSLIPAVSTNFTVIFISRAVLGIGIGLANPLAISLIGSFFTGDTRAKLLGWRSAIAGVGTSIMTYLAGQLLVFNWHAAYWVYLLFVPTLLLFIFFVPEPNSTEEENSVSTQDNEVKTTTHDGLILITLLTLLIFVFLSGGMILAIKLPTYFIDFHIGSATQASNAWSMYNIANVIGGILFGYAYRYLKKYILPLGLLFYGLGIFLTSFTRNLSLIYFLCFATGIFGALVIPYIFNKISESFSTSKAPFYTSIALVGSNLGSFLAPYSGQLMGQTAVKAIFHSGLILIILAIIILIVFVLQNGRRQNDSKIKIN